MKKVMIVCPVSLVNVSFFFTLPISRSLSLARTGRANSTSGSEEIGSALPPVVRIPSSYMLSRTRTFLASQLLQILSFLRPTHQILIIGYERLRSMV